MSKTEQGPRLAQIDGLRGLAAVLVVAFHFTARYQDKFGFVSAPPARFDAGLLGVQLFFVISGYVIFMTAERARHPLHFVVSRLSRLFPTFWVCVLLTGGLMWLVRAPMHPVPLLHLLGNLTMIPGLLQLTPVDGVYWSLEVELIFYAWMLLLAGSASLRRVEPVLIGWLFLSVLSAASVSHGWGRVPELVQHLLLLRWIPWFALGMLVYRVHERQQVTQPQLIAAVLAITSIDVEAGAQTALIALGCALLVWRASIGRLPLLGRWLPVGLGAISYPLYLCHQHIGWMIIHGSQANHWSAGASITLACVVTLTLAALLHLLVELPLSRDLRQWLSACIAPWAGQAVSRPNRVAVDSQLPTQRA